jgi:hypothetical protein
MVLLVLVSVLSLCVYYSTQTEGFEDTMISLSACPTGYTTFYADEKIACCKGEVVGERCLTSEQCTLTGEGSKGMPSCATIVLNEYKAKSTSQCPTSMPHYYEDRNTQKKGCTSSPLHSDLSKPLYEKAPMCRVYPTMEENHTAPDSCVFQKALDEFPCFGTNCTKSVFTVAEGQPPLLAVHFVDTTGMVQTAYTRASMENYLDKTRPNWRNQGIHLDKSISVAEVAKAYYVDRTLSASDIEA